MSEAPDRDAFRRVMSGYPTGVTIVTANGADGPSGMTANAVASLSLDPLMMLVCFDRTARTLESVRHAGHFGINVLAVGQEELASTFASKLDTLAKWEGTAWTERGGSPAFDGTAAYIACRLGDLVEGGDHLIAMGEVLEVAERDAVPLLWYRGSYRSPD